MQELVERLLHRRVGAVLPGVPLHQLLLRGVRPARDGAALPHPPLHVPKRVLRLVERFDIEPYSDFSAK